MSDDKDRELLLLMEGGAQVPIKTTISISEQWGFERKLKKWLGPLLREVR